jgi:hypothetical protein
MKRLIIFLLAILLAATARMDKAMAQFHSGLNLTAMYDDNVNNNYLGITDKVTQLSLQTAYDREGEAHNTQIFYSGTLNYFNTVKERTFHYHSTGLTHSKRFGQSKPSLLNAGITYNLRVDREEYTFYDHQQFSVYANLKHPLTESLLGRLGYSLRYLHFKELGDFNYTEHYFFAQLTRSLATRTTIIVEADLGTKIYATGNIDTAAASTGRRGRGRLMATSTPRVTQLIGLARVGQSIFEDTGLSVTAQYQINLQKDSRFLSSDSGTISGDELFDDHYGYEGLQASAMLTQLLPASMVMKISAGVQNRNYSVRSAYDLLGNMVADKRVDTHRALSAQLEKQFNSLGISIGLSFDYIHNTSNDFYYDYHNHALAVEMAIGR